jgi:hypothetical protein
MRNTSIGIVALLLACFPIKANADWLNDFSYDVTVSKSGAGPFGADTRLWSSPTPEGFTPSYIDLHGTKTHWGFEQDGTFYHELASSYVTLGKFDKDLSEMPHVPFFLKVTLHDKASGLSESVMLGGAWKTPTGFSPVLDFAGQAERRIGNHLYKVNIGPPLGLPMAAGQGPDDVYFPVEAVAFMATIERIEVAHAPEPATLILVLPVSVLFGAMAIRRRFIQFN